MSEGMTQRGSFDFLTATASLAYGHSQHAWCCGSILWPYALALYCGALCHGALRCGALYRGALCCGALFCGPMLWPYAVGPYAVALCLWLNVCRMYTGLPTGCSQYIWHDNLIYECSWTHFKSLFLWINCMVIYPQHNTLLSECRYRYRY